MIGLPIGSGVLPWPTAVSLISTIRVLDKEGLKFKLESLVGSSVVQWARSAIVGSFLKSDCTHLFFVDSDIVWTPSDFIRLLGFGAHLDVVGATYPVKTDEGNFFVKVAAEDGQMEVNGFGCVRINGMGLGFTLCKRAVIEKVAAGKPLVHDRHNGMIYPDVFRVDRTQRSEGLPSPRGEDVAFFDDVREAGFDCWLDPSIDLGHVGQKVYRADIIASLGLQDYVKEIPQ